jgi:DNA-directed RNA polymerase specialized sigma24 family protein
MNDSDSVALIQKIAGGNTSAMLNLYDRTSRLLFGLISRILPESTAAEEVLLEVYTCIWRQGDAYEPRGGTPLAWMMGIARGRAIDRLRSEKPDRQRPELVPIADGSGVQGAAEDANIAEARQQLLRSAIEIAPPDYIRDLLAARIEREPRAATLPPPQPVRVDKTELRHAEPPRPAPSPAPQRRASAFPWILAATFALAAALGFFLWLQSQKRAEQAIQWQKDDANEARAETQRLRSLIDSERTRSREITALDAALSSPGANVICLASRRPGAAAAAAIFWDTNKSAWIVLGHLPPAPSGKEYQLWFVTPDGRKSAGLIPVDASGHSFAALELPPDLGKITAAEITPEPAGGSQQPTSPPIATGKAG